MSSLHREAVNITSPTVMNPHLHLLSVKIHNDIDIDIKSLVINQSHTCRNIVSFNGFFGLVFGEIGMTEYHE